MGMKSRRKGQRGEHAIVRALQDAGIPAEKLSRAGYTGPDISMADGEFTGEIKLRANGQGFSMIKQWIRSAELLFLKEDREAPLVVVKFDVFCRLVQAYLRFDLSPLEYESNITIDTGGTDDAPDTFTT